MITRVIYRELHYASKHPKILEAVGALPNKEFSEIAPTAAEASEVAAVAAAVNQTIRSLPQPQLDSEPGSSVLSTSRRSTKLNSFSSRKEMTLEEREKKE